jgi:hypothetical protein
MTQAQTRALTMLKNGPLKRVDETWYSRTGQLVAHGTVLHLVRMRRVRMTDDRKQVELA